MGIMPETLGASVFPNLAPPSKEYMITNNNIPVYHASCVAKAPIEAQDKGPLGDSDANASGRGHDAQLGPAASAALAGVT